MIVRGQLDKDEAENTRLWASSDPTADLKILVSHIATCGIIEVLFADTKELLGLDRYQLMSATAIRHLWTLVVLAYLFLDQERDQLQRELGQHVTIEFFLQI
jgi:hypothetical protein